MRIVSFESRRAHDLASLLRRSGGEVVYAPALREIPRADEPGILEFGGRLESGECDALMLLTGVGTTILIDALCTRWPRAAILDRLARTRLICRGPKPAAALQAAGLLPAAVAREPHGDEQLLELLVERLDVAGKRVFVQEYGAVNGDLAEGLEARGARVTPVKVYRWALPVDTRDLRAALQSIAQSRVDAAIFTSTHQVENALEFAQHLGLGDALRAAFRRSVLVASIGPVTNEALRRHGITPDLTPDRPQLAALVATLGLHAGELQRSKRAQRA